MHLKEPESSGYASAVTHPVVTAYAADMVPYLAHSAGDSNIEIGRLDGPMRRVTSGSIGASGGKPDPVITVTGVRGTVTSLLAYEAVEGWRLLAAVQGGGAFVFEVNHEARRAALITVIDPPGLRLKKTPLAIAPDAGSGDLLLAWPTKNMGVHILALDGHAPGWHLRAAEHRG
jgi:hypothetical protein